MTMESDAFEQRIHRLHELIESTDSEVTWNDHIRDPNNPKQSRQIDVTIKRGNALTLVECRLRNSRQDVKWIEELIGRKISLQASAVIAVSASGFTEGAVLKAKAHGIFLRNLEQLTPDEVTHWGRSIAMTIYYYQYQDLKLDLYFASQSISKLNMLTLSNELKAYPGRQSLFNASATELGKLKLLMQESSDRKDVHFKIRLHLEDFRLCGEPVIEVQFSGIAKLIESPLTIPAIAAYREPTTSEQNVVIQKTSLGETEAIIHNGRRVATILDLSSISLPPNCQFRYLRTTANYEMDMESFELLGSERLNATAGPMTITINAWSS